MVLLILLIYIPGHVVLSVAGRKREDRKINSALQYGMLMFGVALVFDVLWELITNGNMFSGILAVLISLGDSSETLVNIEATLRFFIVAYVFAFVTGIIELWLAIGLPHKRKDRVRIDANDPIRGVFVGYRREKQRPYIKAVLINNQVIEGECVKYGWNGEESILLRDNKGSLIWVPLREIHLIGFENLGMTIEGQREKERNRRILNRIADGLGDEMYAKTEED